jgi:hypothetical protein
MTTKTTDDFLQRVVDALEAESNYKRGRLAKEHPHAYWLLTMTASGFIKPDGVSEQGTAAITELAEKIGVPREPVSATEGKSKK